MFPVPRPLSPVPPPLLSALATRSAPAPLPPPPPAPPTKAAPRIPAPPSAVADHPSASAESGPRTTPAQTAAADAPRRSCRDSYPDQPTRRGTPYTAGLAAEDSSCQSYRAVLAARDRHPARNAPQSTAPPRH